jgi:predicted CXXCH cytochrome family protein
VVVGLIVGLAAPAARGQWHVKDSPHDLSTGGPGPVRAVSEDEICIFCHTPHNAAPDAPLWNRYSAPRHYRIYQSSTTDARIDQPRGKSKLCLSCHDGVLAVGLVRSRGETDRIKTTVNALRREHGGLGTDLGDDHPIGFRYDRALANADPQLRYPDTISEHLPLGKHGWMECTTCHDAHNNRLGNFLRVPEQRSTICVSCHKLFGWRASAHANSSWPVRGRLVDPAETLPYSTVAENGCAICHKVHTARGRERLLRFRQEERNCLNCHNGSGALSNILSQCRKRSAHNPFKYLGIHDPARDPRLNRPHVECVSCHNPHAARNRPVVDALVRFDPLPKPVGGTLLFVSGVSRTGRYLERSRFEYEVCLKCHSGTWGTPPPTVSRQVPNYDIRRQFQTRNPSYHPVYGQGRNLDAPSLTGRLNRNSVIACTDCHNSDNARSAGGSGPEGPHGSIYEPLLNRNYEVRDPSLESANAYALCYQCHARSSILSSESFPLHRTHIVNAQASCSVCHAAHGVTPSSRGGDHTHLINFDISVVRPSDQSRQILFRDTGRLRGSCTLNCHNFNHENLTYQR